MASLNDFNAEVENAGLGQPGIGINQPTAFVTPLNGSTASTVETQLTADNSLQQVLQQEEAEFAGLFTAGPAFAPTPVDPVTGEEKAPYRVEVTGYALPQQPLINPLHDYDSYTYNLSLHAITVEQFNNLNDNPSGYRPLNVLIAGAGKYSPEFRRNPYFQEDFYFDDLMLDSVINTKKTNRFSNVFNIEFTIIEPKGFTFIQRLISACEAGFDQGGVSSPNYIKQPFILQIDFYGQKDGNIGAGIIPNQTKLIPIKLVGMNTRVSNKGTEYRITAVPFNHNAFSPSKINLPANFSIKAAKVADIFAGGVSDGSSAEAQRYFDQIEARRAFNESLNQDFESAEAVLANQGINRPQVTQTLGEQGLAAGYNSFYKTLEEKNGLKNDRIKFELDPEFAESLIYTGGPNDISNAATTADQKTSNQVSGGANKGTILFNSGTLNIPAGTNLQSVIEWAVTNSEYMRKQLIGIPGAGDPNKGARQQSAEILKLVKIVPKVRILDYDPKRDNFRYEITYYIKKYLANSRAPNAPQGRVSGWVKEYNYIYTGGISPYTGDNASNRDVLNVDLDFNMLFFTTVTAFKEKAILFNTGKTQATGADNAATVNSEFRSQTDTGGNQVPTGEFNPAKPLEDRVNRAEVVYNAGNKRNQTRTGAGAASVQASADVINNQLLDARGDMINVKLTIVGDPHFIKQDDILYNENLAGQTSLLTPNNSLYTDNGELYVYLNFKSPIDYDESTGLAIPQNNAFSYSLFTGVYKVITVESRFRAGTFTQVLDLVRLPISDSNRQREIQSSYRPAFGFEIGTGQNLTFPFGQVPGQRIIGTLFSGALLNGGAGLEGLASSAVQKAFQEVQSVVVKEIGRLTSDIFSTGTGGDLIPGIDFDPEVGDLSLFNTITDIDLPALNALEDSFGSLSTDVISNIDLFDLDFNASVPAALPDIDYLGSWL